MKNGRVIARGAGLGIDEQTVTVGLGADGPGPDAERNRIGRYILAISNSGGAGYVRAIGIGRPDAGVGCIECRGADAVECHVSDGSIGR